MALLLDKVKAFGIFIIQGGLLYYDYRILFTSILRIRNNLSAGT